MSAAQPSGAPVPAAPSTSADATTLASGLVVPDPHTSPRLGVKALIVDRGHVLMNHIVTPAGEHLYGPPGGGQEYGETQVDALIREGHEEIGAQLEVFQVACVYEVQLERRVHDGTPIPPFHQVNIAYWCGLAEGAEPGLGIDPDPGQVGCQWLPIAELERYDLRPVELGRWLQSDPSSRPVGIGPTTP